MNFKLELRERTSATTFALYICDFAAGALECFSRLFVHIKIASFQPELRECVPRTTSVLSANFEPELRESATFILKSYDCAAVAAGAYLVHTFVLT